MVGGGWAVVVGGDITTEALFFLWVKERRDIMYAKGNRGVLGLMMMVNGGGVGGGLNSQVFVLSIRKVEILE